MEFLHSFNFYHLLVCSFFILWTTAMKEDGGSVEFYLYNNYGNNSRTTDRQLKWRELETLNTAGWNSNEPLILFIHGFLHNHTCMFPQQLIDSYFNQNNPGNFVAVNWGKIAQPPGDYKKSYIGVLKKISIVSWELSQLILTLHQNNFTQLDHIHIIGFSLGSHIAGGAGNLIAKTFPLKIGRITALDPAGPFFHPYVNPPFSFFRPRSLSKMDAQFVDVVHTDMADTFWSQLMGSEFGTNQKLGHADFYINGGRPHQPACRYESDAESRSTCSHDAAPNYFMQSIGTTQYGGCLCTYNEYQQGACDNKEKCRWAVFGDEAASKVEGDFYVNLTTLVEMKAKYSC